MTFMREGSRSWLECDHPAGMAESRCSNRSEEFAGHIGGDLPDGWTVVRVAPPGRRMPQPYYLCPEHTEAGPHT